ncbi:MFS transporter [Paenibacillus hexagrammi]|uniref:MFS transporter n=1 Tax=Paenibacillus hexagrammi TaxID=2908839 RepID=A0ABY3SK49_9BACL|nr:MFS transporter [Paenibacillus sp. YPD9-1]UJF34424.1 MFS transporter [Paenibacillus sp. YPD9-1]
MEPVQAALSNKKNYLYLLLVVFVGFLVFGFSENIKGPAIPKIQQDFKLDEFQIGTLLSFNSLGYLLACSFTGILSRKLGLKLTCLLAFGSMVLSGVLIAYSSHFLSFSASYFFMYIGNGMLEIALAILGAKIFIKNTGMMMNLSHFFYGLSSIAAPILASVLMGAPWQGDVLGWRGMYVFMLALSLLPMIPSLLARFPVEETDSHEQASLRTFVRDPIAWLIVVILSFGVISELSIGSWLVNFLEKAYQWDLPKASGMLSLFFLCFTFARLVLGSLTDKIGFILSLVWFSAFSGLCSLVAIAAGPSGAFLFALAGVGIAPIYPTVMAVLAKRYRKNSDMAITFTVTMMGIASVVGNFLVGAITDGFRTYFTSVYSGETGLVIGLQAGYVFIGSCALFCSIVSFYLYRRLKRQDDLL